MYSRFKQEFTMENYLDFTKEKDIDLHLHDLDCPHTILPYNAGDMKTLLEMIEFLYFVIIVILLKVNITSN